MKTALSITLVYLLAATPSCSLLGGEDKSASSLDSGVVAPANIANC